MDPATIALIINALFAAGGAAGEYFGKKGGKDQSGKRDILDPKQKAIIDQINEMVGPGAGSAIQYYLDMLSNNPEAFAKFEAPAIRQFNEQIVPNIAERFSGLGAGAQGSSAFPAALSQAGAQLSENLAAMRENLKAGAAQGIGNFIGIGQQPTFAYQEPKASPWAALAGAGAKGVIEGLPDWAGNKWGTPAAPGAGENVAKAAGMAPGQTGMQSYPIGGQNPYSYGRGYGNMPYGASGLNPRY